MEHIGLDLVLEVAICDTVSISPLLTTFEALVPNEKNGMELLQLVLGFHLLAHLVHELASMQIENNG